jgi:hypothetical protein
VKHEALNDVTLSEIIFELALDYGSQIPFIIPSFNNPTYLVNMLKQLETIQQNNILILDGGSMYPPMLQALDSISQTLPIVVLPFNPGPRLAITSQVVLDALPNFFAVTDPDLSFNPCLPSDFINTMIELSNELSAPKIGFALDVSDSELMRKEKFKIGDDFFSIQEWEKQFWEKPKYNKYDLPLFEAQIDTTFAIYNQNFYHKEDFLAAYRVAGDYTAVHLPWMLNTSVPESEINFYKRYQEYSYYSLR